MVTNIPSNAVLSFMIMNDESRESSLKDMNVNKVKQKGERFLMKTFFLFAAIKQCLKQFCKIQIRIFNKLMKLSPKEVN